MEMAMFKPTLEQRKCFDNIRSQLKNWVVEYEKHVNGRHLFTSTRRYFSSSAELKIIIDKIMDFVMECQEQDYDHISGEDFMGGLRTTHPDLYRFSVGYFGGHDFIWRLK